MSKKLQVLQKEEIISPFNIKTVTNVNGSAIMFPDGTMICRCGNITVSVDITNYLHSGAGKSDLAYGYVDAGWAIYPVPFVETPVCDVFVTSTANIAFVQIKSERPLDKLPGFYPYTNITGTFNTTVSYIAIGRWKVGEGEEYYTH